MGGSTMRSTRFMVRVVVVITGHMDTMMQDLYVKKRF